MGLRPKTLKERIESWGSTHGCTVVSSAESAFIAAVRQAEAAGVGYHVMHSVLEWLWDARLNGYIPEVGAPVVTGPR